MVCQVLKQALRKICIVSHLFKLTSKLPESFLLPIRVEISTKQPYSSTTLNKSGQSNRTTLTIKGEE